MCLCYYFFWVQKTTKPDTDKLMKKEIEAIDTAYRVCVVTLEKYVLASRIKNMNIP